MAKGKKKLKKEKPFKKVLLAVLPGLIVAGLVFAANTYYDLDLSKIIVEEVQRVTKELEAAGGLTAATTTINQLFTTNGNMIFGSDSSDTAEFKAYLTSHLIPFQDIQYDLGTSTLKWRNLYVATTTIGDTIIIGTDTITATSTLNITAGAASTWKTTSGDLTIKIESGNLVFQSSADLIEQFGASASFVLKQGTTARLAIDGSGNISATGTAITLAGPLTTKATTTLATTGNLYFHSTNYYLNQEGDLLIGGRLTFESAEFISNETDGLILFQGSAGTNDTDLVFDLDGAYPIIYSATDTKVGLDDSLEFTGTSTISTAQGDLTLDTAANKIIIKDALLQFDSTTQTFDLLSVAGTTTLVIENSDGTQAANLNLADGSLYTGGTERLTVGGALLNITGYTQPSGAWTATTTSFTINGSGNVVFGTSGQIQQTGTGQVTFAGNVDATAGLDVTNAALTAAAGFTVSGGATNISGTSVSITPPSGAITLTAGAASTWKTTSGSLEIKTEGSGADLILTSADELIATTTGALTISGGGEQLKLDSAGNILASTAIYQPVYGTDDGLVGYWPFSEKIGDELVQNNSFESDFANWTKFGELAGEYDISTTTAEAKDGSQSVKLDQSTTTVPTAGFGIYQDIANANIDPNTTYQLNGWVKYTKMATDTDGVVLLATSTEIAGVSQTLKATSAAWQFLSLRFTTGSGGVTTTVKFYLSGQNGTSTAYLDLVSLKKANTSKTYDYSPYGNDGTIKTNASDQAPSFVDGKYGQALSFDGVDDYVDCGPDKSLKIPKPITLEEWIYHTGGTSNQFSIGHGQVGNFKYGLVWDYTAGRMYFSFHNGAGWANRATSNPIPENTWVHVVGTWDGARAKIYINGVLEDDQPVTGSIPYVAADRFYLGYALATNHWWNGLIDEARIYNRALSADEIRAHYLRGTGAHGLVQADKFRVLDADNVVNFYLDGSGNAVFEGTVTAKGTATSTLSGPLTITSTSQPQLSVRYDADHKLDISVASTGAVNITGTATTTLATSGNANQLVLAANGNVGIGTTTPAYKLDVNGILRSTLDAYFATASGNVGIGTTNPQKKLHVKTTGDWAALFGEETADPRAGIWAGGAGTADNPYRAIFGAYDSNTQVRLDIGGTDHLIITTDGNVGIGTTDPTSLLELSKTDASTALTVTVATSTTTYDPYIAFRTGSPPATQALIGLDFSEDKLKLVRGSDISTSTGITIDSSGNVGIGTTAPATKLHVYQSASDKSGALINIATTSASYYSLNVQSAGTSRLYVRADGNVGIGTTGPGSRLTVSGGASSFGNLATPSEVTAATTTGGNFSATGTYYYVVAAYDGTGLSSAKSSEVSCLIDSTSTACQISWTAVSGVATYRVFGRATGAQDEYWSTSSTSFTDTGTAGTSGSPPSASISAYFAGNVGIGTTSPDVSLEVGTVGDATSTVRLRVHGSIEASGAITPNTGSDIAERFLINSQCEMENNCPEPGDLVSVIQGKVIEKSSIPYDPKLIGIVSENPAITMASGLDTSGSRPVALAGRVSTKVSLENGPIEVGDPLTSSNQPGVAMKATEPGRVIGLALEPFNGTITQCTSTIIEATTTEATATEATTTQEVCETVQTDVAKVMVFVNPHWSIGSLSDEGSLTLATSSTTTTSEQPSVLDQFTLVIKNSLKKLGLFIENGIAKVKELIAEKLTTKEICLEGDDGEQICVDKNQLKELLIGSNPATTEPICTPDWQCTDWEPDPETIACGETFTQTRICTDLNDCGTEERKPIESQETTGTFCSAQNAIGTCQADGTCSFICQDGFLNCDDDWSNGCEFQLETSTSTCPQRT